MSESKRIIFAGTPDFAAGHLKALIDAGHQVVAAYCQPDRKAGRGRKLVPGPVKQLALEHDIPVEQPLNFKDPKSVEILESYQADLMVVVAYGLLLPESVLNAPRLGCINVHGSILPRWRGAAPIQRAILEGDKESGVTIMQMDKGLDTGDMLLKATCDILDSDTSQDLHDRLLDVGQAALIDAVKGLFERRLSPVPQNHDLANYAHKLTKEEGNIKWSEPALLIDRKIRGLNPWPVAYTQIKGEVMRVWAAEVVEGESNMASGSIVAIQKDALLIQCGQQQLRLLKVQLPGAKAMAVKDILNSKRALFESTALLGSVE